MAKRSYNKRTKPTALSRQSGTAVLKRSRKRAMIFIDGSNWYHKIRMLLNAKIPKNTKSIKPPIDFNLRGFSKNLVAAETLVDIRYYIGKVKRVRGDMKSEAMYANQQRLIGFLQQQDIHIGFGHLINYPDGSFHEKGVDILIAVEMIRCVLEKTCDVVYLMSSDTDLVPAVDECRRLGVEVVYVGSSLHGKSLGLIKACNKTILLQPKDVLPYMPKKIT